MITIILPGHSLSNKAWAFETQANLQIPGEIVVHQWRHWTTGGDIDIDYEVGEIIKKVGGQKVSIIAKSIGTKVFMLLYPHIKDQVQKVILCGIPFDPATYMSGIKSFTGNNLIIFQNSSDPYIPYKPIQLYIRLVNKDIRVVEKKGATHDYPYYSDFTSFLL